MHYFFISMSAHLDKYSLWPKSQGMRIQVSGVAPLRLCESKAVILFELAHSDMSDTEGPEMAKKH